MPEAPSGHRHRFDRERVIAAGADYADSLGVGATFMTLAGLAREVDASVPRLLKHVRGSEDLRGSIAARALDQLGAEIADSTARLSGSAALRVAASAYRGFAQAHPGRYTLAFATTHWQNEDYAAAGERLVGVVQGVLIGRGLDRDGMVDAVRILRATLHGFVTLEAAGGFALARSVDSTFEVLIGSLDASGALGVASE